MKAQFRPTTPADAPAIAAFLGSIFDARPGEPILDPEMMQWKYWRPRPGWQGSRSYVLERGGSIVAHGAAWPGRILASAEIPCFFLIDWAASPEFPGGGVSIMKHMSQMVPVNFLYGGTEIARKMRFAMGYRPRNEILSLALPLRPLRQILASRRLNWKTPARVARNLLWSYARPPASGQWRVRAVDPREIRNAGNLWPRPDPHALTVHRDAELFEYFAACPAAPASFFLILRGSEAAGYFCMTFPPGQARIADAWIDSSSADDWARIYGLIIELARQRPEVHEIVAAAPDQTCRAALERCGFHVRAVEPVQLYDPQKLVPPDLPFQVQLIDGDAAFRYASGPAYLT